VYEADTAPVAHGRVGGSNKGLWTASLLSASCSIWHCVRSFYQCADKSGAHGLYLSLVPIPTPPTCTIVTLHSRDVSGAEF
jgi:hypothetical protein